MQLWDLASELCKKICVRKCSTGTPHLCIGAAYKLRCSALILAWAMPVPSHVPCWFGPWPTDLISSFDLRPTLSLWTCLVITAVLSDLDYCHHPCSIYSRSTFVDEASVSVCLTVTLGSPPFEEKPALAADRCVSIRVSETLSQKTVLQSVEILIFQQKSMLTLYLYHKISSKMWFTTVVLIFCMNQEMFLNKRHSAECLIWKRHE